MQARCQQPGTPPGSSAAASIVGSLAPATSLNRLIPPACSNIHVAIVTAAGYPGAPERFEQRVEGLLAAFRQLNLPQHITDRWAGRRGCG